MQTFLLMTAHPFWGLSCAPYRGTPARNNRHDSRISPGFQQSPPASLGLVAPCIGGSQGIAAIVERPWTITHTFDSPGIFSAAHSLPIEFEITHRLLSA